jgi:D-serine deaminase-like pyridoxal phosphate-dependent protein
MRKRDEGGPHDAYFLGLSSALERAGLARPTLVIDQARLQANIKAVKAALPARQHLRIVVKSLPCASLIDAVAEGMGTERFMVFNAPMMATLALERPGGDYLMGKPLAAAEAKGFYRDLHRNVFDPEKQLQWLIDSPERLDQYSALASANGAPMRVNLEIDIGLHRGGFSGPEGFKAALDRIKATPNLTLAGLMGYDPHLSHVAAGEARAKALGRSQKTYQAFIDQVREAGFGLDGMTLNTAGSPTFHMHHDNPYATEVSVGSAFVKPTDFDTDTLRDHVPAAFIATPVIKALPETLLPTAEQLAGLLRFMDPNTSRAFFIHGGHWLATPVSPPGLEYSSLFGRSSNQELLTGSTKITLQADDYIFLRPNQSEAVFLQFGDIALYDGREIKERWPVFSPSA